MTLFRGLCAFPITPADPAGRVDAGALRLLLERLAVAGAPSIGLLGSTGSTPYLARAERRRAIEAAVDQVAGRASLLVGIGALRTDEAVQFGQDAKAAGADGVLLAPMCYTPLLDAEVFTHCETVAQAVGLPLCLYNNPSTTHFTFTPALVARLSRLPHIAAVKNPSPPAGAVATHLREWRAAVRPGFSLGYSVDAHAAEAMVAGGDAWHSVIGGLFPQLCLKILAAAPDEARALNARLQPMWNLFTEFSSLRVIYAAVNHLGLCHTAPPRPILPLPEAAQRRVAQVLAELELA